jgi:hypothetical protein
MLISINTYARRGEVRSVGDRAGCTNFWREDLCAKPRQSAWRMAHDALQQNTAEINRKPIDDS